MWYSYANTPGFTLAMAMTSDGVPSNLSGFLAFCSCTIGITAAYYNIRRVMFENFYYMHIISGFFTYAFAIAHQPTLALYMIPSFSLYIYDIYLRTYNRRNFCVNATIVPVQSGGTDRSIGIDNYTSTNTTTNSTKLTKIIIDINNIPIQQYKTNICNYKAGQYYILIIPTLSSYQAHPFSISTPTIQHTGNTQSSTNQQRTMIVPLSARLEEKYNTTNINTTNNSVHINNNTLTFHILNNNITNNWTSQLYDLAVRMYKGHNYDQSEPVSGTVPIYMDGPFGSAFKRLGDHSTVVFICGG